MLVGENPRVGDMPVNPVKEKHLDNMRSSGKDKTSKLTPPVRFSLERAIEYIDIDELVVSLVPYLLGAGIPLFATGLERHLKLHEQRSFSSGVVQLHYQVLPENAVPESFQQT